MIVYDLTCAAGHTFEGWFEDRKAFDAQKRKKLISCPICNDLNVTCLPSAFSIKSSQKRVQRKLSLDNPEAFEKLMCDYLEKNFDNVGCDFSKEALKIHYGVSEQRNIRGTSTKEEENILEKEGISFMKIPVPVSSDSDS
jgi:hypothetical protein